MRAGNGPVSLDVARPLGDVAVAEAVERVRVWLEWPDDATPRLWALAAAGPPPTPFALPVGAELRDLLARLNTPVGAIDEIVGCAPTRASHPEGWWLLERLYHTVVEREVFNAPPPWPAPVPIDDDPFTHYFHLYVFLGAVDDLLRFHARRDVPEDVTWTTLRDVGLQVANYHVRNGRPGFDGAFWVWPHFRGEVFTLGRLQYEALDGPAVGVHIPSLGPLDPAACDESLEVAARFFAEHYSERTYTTGICDSWLLDEQLRDYLAPDANIISFQQRFAVDPEWSRPADDDVLRFVFGRLPASLDELPQTTSLERAVVAHLRAGNHWRFRRGTLAL